MYTLNAVILGKYSIHNNKHRVILFTREYGKFSAWYTKAMNGVDIGDIVSCGIIRDQGINRIKWIEGQSYLMQKQWTYGSLIHFLNIIKVIRYGIADEDSHPQIYDDYVNVIHSSEEYITADQSLLIQIRILKRIGSLHPDFFNSDKILRYIYGEIDRTPLNRILSGRPLHANHRTLLVQSSLHALDHISR